MDEELRKLEKAAALGDAFAVKKLRQMRRRISASKSKKFYHCLTWHQIWKLLGFDFSKFEEDLMDYMANLVHEMITGLEEENEDWDPEKEDTYNEKLYGLVGNKLFRDVISATKDVVSDVVEDINRWGDRGVQSVFYERDRHKSGIAVELIPVSSNQGGLGTDIVYLDQPAFCFQLYRPFLGVYTEAVYCVTSIGDEGYTLGDMKGSDVINAGKWIAECEGVTSLLNKLMDQLSNLDLYPSIWEFDKMQREIEGA